MEAETETFVAVDDSGNRVPVQVVRSGDNLVIFLNEGQSIEGVTEALTQGIADGGQGQYQIMVTDNYQEGQAVENIQQAEGYEQIQETAIGEEQAVVGIDPAETVSAESYQQYQVDQLVETVQPVQVETVPDQGTEQIDAFVPAVAQGEEAEVNAFVPAVAKGEESEVVTAYVSAVGSEGVSAYVSAVASGEESEGVNAFVSAVASGFQEPVGGGHPGSGMTNVNIPIDSNFQLPVTQYDTNSYAVASSIETSNEVAGQFIQSTVATVTDSVAADQFEQDSGAAVEGVIETQSQFDQSSIATAESGVGTTSDTPGGGLEIDLGKKQVAGAAPPIEVITSIDDLIVSQPVSTNTTTEQVDKPFVATRVAPTQSDIVASFVPPKTASQTTFKYTPVSKTISSKSAGVSILLKCEKCDQVFFTASELKAHRDRVHPSLYQSIVTTEKKILNESDLTSLVNKNLCSICHVICPSLQALIQHKNEVHGLPMPFKCETCNFGTTQKRFLDVHMKSHQKKLYCKICQTTFESEEQLNKHAAVHGRDKYQCFYCSKMYLTRKACTDHIALKHSAAKQTDTPVSEAAPAATQQSKLEPAPRVESSESSSQTEIHHNLLEEVDQTSTDEGAAQTLEELNKKETEKEQEMEVDALAQTEEQELPMDTVTDENVMDTDDGVDNKDVAGKDEPDVDAKMDTTPKTESDPQKPPEGLEDFTPLKVRDFQCLACYSEFSTEPLFQDHFLRDHTQDNTCLVCGRDFAKRFLLRCHFHETHCCLEVYKCKNCDRVFNMVQKYWKHAAIHARRHVCSTCDRAFSIPSELKRHQMAVHAEKTYFCVYCPESFSSPVDLRTHKEEAHDMKPGYNKKEVTQAKGEKTERKTASIGSSAKSLIQQAKESGSQMTIKIFRDGTYMTTDPNTGKSDYGTIDLSNLGLDPAFLQTHNDLELVIIPPDKEEETDKEKEPGVSNSEPDKLSPVKLIKTTASETPKSVTSAPADKTSRPVLKGTFHVEKSESADSGIVYRKQVMQEGRSFSCRFCPRTFRYYRHLRCHENAHSRNEKYICHICQRMFVRETNLKLHLDLHKKKDTNTSDPKSSENSEELTTPENLDCDTCGKVFHQKAKLNRHIKEVHESKPIECHICQKTFRSESNAQRHMKTHYGPFACAYCTEYFKDEEELKTHVKELHQMNIHTCHICNKDLFSFGKLLSHVKLIHPDNKEALQEVNSRLKCEICQKQFASTKSLKNHKMTHTGEKKYQCPHCPWKFYLAWKLKKHMSKAHESETPVNKFSCDMCLKDFFKEEALQNHQTKVHPAPYKCQLCKMKKFSDKEKFREHCDEKHSGNCVKCNLCELPFTSGRHLQIHQNSSHEKTFLCDLCGYAFGKKDEMHEHLKFSHFDGDEGALKAVYPNIEKSLKQTDYDELRKTLTCPNCENTFKNLGGLISHMKSCDVDNYEKHKKEKKDETEHAEYKDLRDNPICTSCGKSFKNLAAVVSHMKYCGKNKSSMKLPVKIQKHPSPIKKENEDDIVEDNEYVPFSYLETGKYVRCDQCQKTFSKRESLRKHLLLHAGIKKKPDKDKHLLGRADKKVDTPKSQEKDKQPSNSRKLEPKLQSAGRKAKHLFDVQKKKCTDCNIAFTSLYSLKRHMQRRHPEAGIRVDSKLLTEPMKTKKGGSKDETKTEEEISQLAKNQFLEMNFSLGMKTEPSSDLNSPVIETVKTKRHDCSLCGLKFSREATLKKHLAEVHSEEDIPPESDSSSDESMDTEEIPSSPVKTRHMLKTSITKAKVKQERELTPKPTSSKNKIEKEVAKTKIKQESKGPTPKTVHNKSKIGKEDRGSAKKTEIGKTKIKKEKEEKSIDDKVQTRSSLKAKSKGTKTEKKELGKCKHCDKTFNSKLGLDRHLRYNHKELKGFISSLTSIRTLRSQKTFHNLRVKKKLNYLPKPKPTKKRKTLIVQQPKGRSNQIKEEKKKLEKKTETAAVIKEEKVKLQKKSGPVTMRAFTQTKQNNFLTLKQNKAKYFIQATRENKAKHAAGIKKPAFKIKQIKHYQDSSPNITKKQMGSQKHRSTKKVKKSSGTSILNSILSQFLKKRLNMILYECEFCDRQFPDKLKLNLHRRKKHSSKVISKSICVCSICGEWFQDLRMLTKHDVTVHNSKPMTNTKIKSEAYTESKEISTEQRNTAEDGIRITAGTAACRKQITLMDSVPVQENEVADTVLLSADNHIKTDQIQMDYSEKQNRDEQVCDKTAVSNQFEKPVDGIAENFVLENDLTSQYIELQNNKGQQKLQKSEDKIETPCNPLVSEAYSSEVAGEPHMQAGIQGEHSTNELQKIHQASSNTVKNANINVTEFTQMESSKPAKPMRQNDECNMDIDMNTDISEMAEAKLIEDATEFEDPVVHDVDMLTGNIIDETSKRAETPIGSLAEKEDQPLHDTGKKDTVMINVPRAKVRAGVTSEATTKQCPICLKKFYTEMGYGKHVSTHTEKKYKCKDCNAKFRWKKNYESHWTLFHTESGGMVCQVCNKIFYDKDIFEKHQVTHKIRKFSCRICKKKFSKHSLMKDHIAEIHTSPHLQRRLRHRTEMLCTVCNIKCSTTEKLLNHMLLHSSRMPAKILYREKLYKYKCKFCPLMFKTKESQKSHLKICDKRTVLAKKLFGGELTDNTCFVCGMKFMTKINTYKHIQTAHGQSSKFKHIDFFKRPTNQKKYFCKSCNGTFAKFASFSMHEKSMYGICARKKKSTKHERCPFCKVFFGSRLILGKHMLKVHNNYLYYSWKHCPYCKQSFSRRLNLKKHMETTHYKRLSESKKIAKKGHSASALLDQQVSNKVAIQKVESIEREQDKHENKYRKIRQSTGVEKHKCEFCGRVHWTIDSFEEHLSKYHADRWIEKSANSPVIPNPSVGEAIEVADNASSDDNKLSSLPIVMVHRLPVDLLIKSSDTFVPEEKGNIDKYLGTPYKFEDNIKNEMGENVENGNKEIQDIGDRSDEDLSNLPELPFEGSIECKTEDTETSNIQKGLPQNETDSGIIDVNFLRLSNNAKASASTLGVPERLPDEILAVTDIKTAEASLKDMVQMDGTGCVTDSSKTENQIKVEKESDSELYGDINERGITNINSENKIGQLEGLREEVETIQSVSETQNGMVAEESKADQYSSKELETEVAQSETESNLGVITGDSEVHGENGTNEPL